MPIFFLICQYFPFFQYHFDERLLSTFVRLQFWYRYRCCKCRKVFIDTSNLIKHLKRRDIYHTGHITIYTCRKGISKEAVVIVTNILKLVNYYNIFSLKKCEKIDCEGVYFTKLDIRKHKNGERHATCHRSLHKIGATFVKTWLKAS